MMTGMTCNNMSSKIITSFKYAYLIVFFALLAGLFYPLITDTSFDSVLFGEIILFAGLAGGILLFRATTTENKQIIFLVAGFALVTTSFYFILQLTGRV